VAKLGKESGAYKAKQELVKEIEDCIKNAKSIIFMDYKGITVAEVNALRAKFRKAGVQYKVYKNTLVKIALNNLGINDLDEKLTGPLAVAFSSTDEVAAAKIVLGEKFKGKMEFKFGLLGTSTLDANGVKALASMPSKETLIAQLMGLIQSGARGLATVISAVPRNLAIVVSEGSKKKSA
jgi:large subunit ribosomal protein L10